MLDRPKQNCGQCQENGFSTVHLVHQAAPSISNIQNTALERTSLLKLLRIILDSRLSRGNNIMHTLNKAQKHNLLERLTATKWGASQDVLAIVYKTYV